MALYPIRAWPCPKYGHASWITDSTFLYIMDSLSVGWRRGTWGGMAVTAKSKKAQKKWSWFCIPLGPRVLTCGCFMSSQKMHVMVDVMDWQHVQCVLSALYLCVLEMGSIERKIGLNTGIPRFR